MRALTATLVLLFLAGIASGQGTTFIRVPDLLDVVIQPERKTYYMFCEETVSVALDLGYTRVDNRNLVDGARGVRFRDFPRLIMRVLELPGFSTDTIPDLLHVEMCIEDVTGYVIESDRPIERRPALRMMPQRLRIRI